MTDEHITNDAVEVATGAVWKTWMERLAPQHELDHPARVKWLQANYADTPNWWQQSIAIEYERQNGLRVVGQSCAGDFQVTCSKTMPWTRGQCFDAVLSTPFMQGAKWEVGAQWDTAGVAVEVRRIDQEAICWFWFDEDGKSIVTVDFWPNKSGEKMQIRFDHSGLASQDARSKYRAQWKAALEQICAT
jgi:hypothetical protein